MRAAIALALVFAGCPCAGNPGVLTGARPGAVTSDPRFVDEHAAIYVSTSTGIYKLALDGSARTKVFAKFPHKDVPAVTVVDVSVDGKTWLLSDSYTNLWIGDPATGSSTEVKAVHGRMSAASVSPDGRWIAASRHSDYGALGKQDEDDTIFLIEIATGKVDTIPAQTKNWPTKIQWAADGSALLLTMAWEAPAQWLTLADRKRTEIPFRYGQPPPAPLRADPRHPPSTCRQKLIVDKGPELSIVDDPEKPAHTIVSLVGRERGFHDYLADFSNVALTPACKFVVFQHARQVWISDLAGNTLAPLAEGDWLFFAF